MTDFPLLARETLHANDYFRIEKDTVSINGVERDYTYVQKNDAVVVVPYLNPQEVLMVNHFRYLARKSGWEFPAGGVEVGETPEAAAGRELFEETGFSAGEITFEGSFYSSRGFSDEVVHIFSARKLTKQSNQVANEEEISECLAMTISLVLEKVKKFEIDGSSSLIAAFTVLLDE